jgi:hypothetical protein
MARNLPKIRAPRWGQSLAQGTVPLSLFESPGGAARKTVILAL